MKKITHPMPAPIEVTVLERPTIPCEHCEFGFRRVDGIHIGSQRLGMIPSEPCERVFAFHVDAGSPVHIGRPWRAYVGGDLLRTRDGAERRFATARTAYGAACRAAPRRWHP